MGIQQQFPVHFMGPRAHADLRRPRCPVCACPFNAFLPPHPRPSGAFGSTADSLVTTSKSTHSHGPLAVSGPVYSRPHAVVTVTRRMSYIHGQDEVLTAVDELWEARRRKAFQQQQDSIKRVAELQEKLEEWHAKSEVRANVRLAEKAVEQKEAMDRETQWRIEKKIQKEREYQERIRLQVSSGTMCLCL